MLFTLVLLPLPSSKLFAGMSYLPLGIGSESLKRSRLSESSNQGAHPLLSAPAVLSLRRK